MLDKFKKIFSSVWSRQMKSEFCVTTKREKGHWLKFEQRPSETIKKDVTIKEERVYIETRVEMV